MDTNKFNGTNYNNWLRNLRIVLNFENQDYILGEPLPTALPEGSSIEEHLTFDKYLEDNRKVRSIILASMINEIQKQYDRFDDIPSIMIRMKEGFLTEILDMPRQKHSSGPRWPKDRLCKATTHKFEPAVLVGEVSTSKAKGKRAGHWKRKNGKGKTVAATASAGGAPAAPTGKGKGKVGGSQWSRTNDVYMHCQGKGH
ncbi:UNVERIFIED_CONTAM: hypothetical protein Sradi_6893700 [Sesamum radiatum]|uniref:DUF4219 domain-containing protein n=1 Tax=Sesamum radiatum TaxID=300843 RepID=A0AAW2JID0_SESRA